MKQSDLTKASGTVGIDQTPSVEREYVPQFITRDVIHIYAIAFSILPKHRRRGRVEEI